MMPLLKRVLDLKTIEKIRASGFETDGIVKERILDDDRIYLSLAVMS